MSAEQQQILFDKGQLSKIASDVGQPYITNTTITLLDGSQITRPQLTEGKLFFGLRDDETSQIIQINGTNVSVGNHRAYIFLDDNEKRYAVTGPVNWSEIIDLPLSSIATKLTLTDQRILSLLSLDNDSVITTSSLPFVLLSGDTMTGPLTIARDDTETAPRVSLDYNATTDSLDFTFA